MTEATKPKVGFWRRFLCLHLTWTVDKETFEFKCAKCGYVPEHRGW